MVGRSWIKAGVPDNSLKTATYDPGFDGTGNECSGGNKVCAKGAIDIEIQNVILSY